MTLKELNEFALRNGLPEDVNLCIGQDILDNWSETDDVVAEVVETAQSSWDEQHQQWIDSRGEKQLSICCRLGKQNRDALERHNDETKGT